MSCESDVIDPMPPTRIWVCPAVQLRHNEGQQVELVAAGIPLPWVTSRGVTTTVRSPR